MQRKRIISWLSYYKNFDIYIIVLKLEIGGQMVKKQKVEVMEKKNILDTISPDDAFNILHTLIKKDNNISLMAEKIANDMLDNVDIEEVADEVYTHLECLCVEDVWGSSGAQSDGGYVEPCEAAWEIFENQLEPYVANIKKYHELHKFKQGKHYCMGVLKGIHLYDTKSSDEFKDWAVDAPGEYFATVLNDWKKNCKSKKDLEEMDAFVEDECV